MISLLPSTRVDTSSSARTSSVTAGPPVRITSMSACFNPRIPGRSESRGSMQVTTVSFGLGGPAPHFGSYVLAYSSFAFSAWSITLMTVSHLNCRTYRIEPEKDNSGQHRRAGSGDQRCGAPRAPSYLWCKALNLEPLGRFLPHTGGRDWSHRRWLHLRCCPSMTRR